MTDKELEKLLKPLTETMNGINQSLRILADAQLVELFTPDQDNRTNWRLSMDKAVEADRLALEALHAAGAANSSGGGYDQVEREHGKAEADKRAEPIKNAMQRRQATSAQLDALTAAQPVLARLYSAYQRVK